MPDLNAAVIGAGPAGCAAAWELAKAGAAVTLYDAAASPGGRTATFRQDGVAVDSGAGFLTANDRLTRAYLGELGLKDQLETMPRSVSFIEDGRRTTLDFGSPVGVARFPFLGWREKLRLVRRLVEYSLRYHRLDYADAGSLADADERTLAERAREDLGEDLYHYFVRPTFQSLIYSDCGDCSQAMMLAMYARPYRTRLVRIRDGMDTLCQRLAATSKFRGLQPVSGLSVGEDGRIAVASSGADGSRDVELVERVVVATTADQALELCRDLPPSVLPPERRSFLETQRYAANIHCVFRVAWPGDVKAFGIFPVGRGRHDVAAVTIHPQAVRDGSGRETAERLVSVYLSDARSRELMGGGGPVAEECWAAARALDETLPTEAEPVAQFVRRLAIPLPVVGRFREAHSFNRAQRPPVVFAGDYLATPCIETALTAGKNAAALLLRG